MSSDPERRIIISDIFCKYCGQKFVTEFDINAHGKKVHGKKQMFSDADIERHRVRKPTKSELDKAYRQKKMRAMLNK